MKIIDTCNSSDTYKKKNRKKERIIRKPKLQ